MVLDLNLPNYASAIRKQYGEKSVIVVMNLSSSQFTSTYVGNALLLGGLSAVSNAEKDAPFIRDNVLTLSPYSYAVCEMQ